MLPFIDLAGPEELVFSELLHPVGQPSRHPGDREDRREEVHVDPEFVVDDAGIEVDVRIDPFLAEQLPGDPLDFEGPLVANSKLAEDAPNVIVAPAVIVPAIAPSVTRSTLRSKNSSSVTLTPRFEKSTM